MPAALRGRRAAFAAVAAIVLAFETHQIFLQSHGTPRATLGRRRFVAEAAGATVVSQTMQLEAAGFDRVSVFPEGGRAASGDAVFELFDLSEDVERLAFRRATPVAQVIHRDRYDFRFPPLESRGRRYRFSIRAPNAPAGAGVALRASNEERYPKGALHIDGREQWGDLAFETGAARATVFRNLEHALRDQPRIVRSRWTLAFVFALYNWALLTFIYYMVFSNEASEGDEST